MTRDEAGGAECYLMRGDAEVDGGYAHAVQRGQLPQRQQRAVQLGRVRHCVTHLLQGTAALTRGDGFRGGLRCCLRRWLDARCTMDVFDGG